MGTICSETKDEGATGPADVMETTEKDSRMLGETELTKDQ